MFIRLMTAGSVITCLMAFGASAQTVAILTKSEMSSSAPESRTESSFEKGMRAFESNDEKTAIRYFDMAISEGANAAIYNKRGCAYARLEQWKNAIRDFNSAISIDSSDAMIYYHRGLAENKTGRYKKSIDDCTKAIALNGSMAEAYLVRGLSIALHGDTEASMTDFRTAIRLRPDYAEAYYNVGLNYYEAGDHENARKYLGEAKKLGFENPELAGYLNKK